MRKRGVSEIHILKICQGVYIWIIQNERFVLNGEVQTIFGHSGPGKIRNSQMYYNMTCAPRFGQCYNFCLKRNRGYKLKKQQCLYAFSQTETRWERYNHCDAFKSIWCTTNTGKYFYTLTAGVMANNTKAMIKRLRIPLKYFK